MSDHQSQEFLFQRVRELLPIHASLVDSVADILNVSSDSAYSRIRGETPLVLEEARGLCNHFKLSLDQLLQVRNNSTMFQHARINTATYSYEQFLRDLLTQLQYISGFMQKEIIYCSKDMPIFHNFYYTPLISFRYFFWMKTILQHPDFSEREFTIDCVPSAIEELSRDLTAAYTRIPSTEIWNTECINAIISQIEFYKDAGHFASARDIRIVYDSLEATYVHLKNQVEYATKYIPDENPDNRKKNFQFYYNRVVLGDNIIMVVADQSKSVFLNYDALNYLTTRDEAFCNSCYSDLKNLVKKGSIISGTSEKQRNIFFGILLTKISDRKKKLNKKS
jgi:hypothetical protein